MPFITEYFPINHGCRWVEPFVGGAAVFLNMFAREALLADSNHDLINLYRSVQRQKDHFVEEVKILATNTFGEADYYEMRNTFNNTCITGEPLKRAVLFYALNRLGYNGMCRYNSKHLYSVPWGKHTELQPALNKIDYLSFRLSGVELTTAGFEETLAGVGGGDQVYCDPPYDKINKTSFVKYDGNSFSQREHVLLADMLSEAYRKGAAVAVSNSMTPFTLELYESRGFVIHKQDAYRSVGCRADSRKKETEILAVLQ